MFTVMFYLLSLLPPDSTAKTNEPGGYYGGTIMASRSSNCHEEWVRRVWEVNGEIMTGWQLVVVCEI